MVLTCGVFRSIAWMELALKACGNPIHSLNLAPRYFLAELAAPLRRLGLGLQFCRLKSLALATGEVATLRQLGVLVHRSIHPDVDTLRVTARALLNSCVVHR